MSDMIDDHEVEEDHGVCFDLPPGLYSLIVYRRLDMESAAGLAIPSVADEWLCSKLISDDYVQIMRRIPHNLMEQAYNMATGCLEIGAEACGANFDDEETLDAFEEALGFHIMPEEEMISIMEGGPHVIH